MNQTPEKKDQELLAAMFPLDDYSRQAASVAGQNGARTETFKEAAEEYAQDPERLHGDKIPNICVNKERPHHILMCYMAAGGKSRKEIAAATGYSETYVGQIMRQPWFRIRFLRIAKEAGQDEVKAFLGMQTLNSLEVLVEIRDSKTEKGQTRVAAANSILDRALGKPSQHVETENHNFDHSNVDDIDRQIAKAEAELKSLGHNTSSGTN